MYLILNSLGGGELFLILAIALIFFGSKGLPSIAKTLGKGMRQMKDAKQSIQDEIMNATQDIQSDLRDIKRGLTEEVNSTKKNISETFSEEKLKPLQPDKIVKNIEPSLKLKNNENKTQSS